MSHTEPLPAELMKAIAEGIRYQTKCPYCKKAIIGKTKPEVEGLFDEHLKTCEKYKEYQASEEKIAKFAQKMRDAGLSNKDIAKLFRPDHLVEKKLRAIMKEYQMTGDELIEFIERMDRDV